MAISSYVRPRLDLGSRLLRRARTHYLAESGAKRAMLELEKDDTDSYDALSDSWATGRALTGELRGGTFTVKFVDEESKININTVKRDVLKDLFEIIGEADSMRSEELADALMDWRDEDDDTRDDGAEDGYYSLLRPGYPCKNGPFEILEELLLVKGMDAELLEKIRDKVTIYSEGTVNINTADGLVLRCLGLDEELVGKILSYRKGTMRGGTTEGSWTFDDVGGITTYLNEAEGLSNEEIAQVAKVFATGIFSVTSDNFMGESLGKVEGRPDASRVIFVFDRKNKKMKYWKER
ncbi:MAG: general secretion pathway protein GspK [Omnitrophica bacterium]|nr:general secretion pathway protein GspK [Candidatus Omnitrophota bacterium]